jgi:hypothetical protein
MNEPDWKGALAEAFDHALAYFEGLPGRPIIPPATLPELRAALGGPLPEQPVEDREVVADLAMGRRVGQRPLLRIRGRRHHSSSVGGGLAGLELGPKRRFVRSRAGGQCG